VGHYFYDKPFGLHKPWLMFNKTQHQALRNFCPEAEEMWPQPPAISREIYRALQSLPETGCIRAPGSVVLVELQSHQPALLRTLKSVYWSEWGMEKKGWDLYLILSSELLEQLHQDLNADNNIKSKVIKEALTGRIPSVHICTVKSQNLSSTEQENTNYWVRASPELYQAITTENILLIPSDGVFCSKPAKPIEYFFKYEFIGMGGFSLRKRSKILELLQKYEYYIGAGSDGHWMLRKGRGIFTLAASSNSIFAWDKYMNTKQTKKLFTPLALDYIQKWVLNVTISQSCIEKTNEWL
jgi:hypothetical protein